MKKFFFLHFWHLRFLASSNLGTIHKHFPMPPHLKWTWTDFISKNFIIEGKKKNKGRKEIFFPPPFFSFLRRLVTERARKVDELMKPSSLMELSRFLDQG